MEFEMTVFRMAVLTMAIACPALAQQVPSSAPPPPQVVTSAAGEARIRPDRATITIGVQVRAATAAEAASENARKQRAIIDAIKAKGVAAEDITTANYSVTPETRYREGQAPITTGFLVSNEVSVDVKSIDRVGPVIDAALANGANQINSLSFRASNADSARRVALADAVLKARADAEVMARAAGGSLGSLLELTATDVYAPPIPRPMMAMARATAESTPVEAGDQTIRASVSARWQFVPQP
jgi:uncharacterized protein